MCWQHARHALERLPQHADVQEGQRGKSLIVRRRGNSLLRREERQELAHVLDAKLARMPATEMNDESPNPMHIRRDRSFTEAALASETAYLLEKPVPTFRIRRGDEMRARDQHRSQPANRRQLARHRFDA